MAQWLRLTVSSLHSIPRRASTGRGKLPFTGSAALWDHGPDNILRLVSAKRTPGTLAAKQKNCHEADMTRQPGCRADSIPVNPAKWQGASTCSGIGKQDQQEFAFYGVCECIAPAPFDKLIGDRPAPDPVIV